MHSGQQLFNAQSADILVSSVNLWPRTLWSRWTSWNNDQQLKAHQSWLQNSCGGIVHVQKDQSRKTGLVRNVSAVYDREKSDFTKSTSFINVFLSCLTHSAILVSIWIWKKSQVSRISIFSMSNISWVMMRMGLLNQICSRVGLARVDKKNIKLQIHVSQFLLLP